MKRQGTSKSESGFTLIELLAATALVSILTLNFLPAVQRAREAANRAAAEQTLKQIAATMESEYKLAGKFPDSFEQVVARSLNFANPAGHKDGYQFYAAELTPKRLKVVADPVAGVTGSMTGILELNFTGPAPATSLNFVPTPGADQGREAMLANLRTQAAGAFGRMLNFALPAVQKTLSEQARAFADAPSSAQDVFNVAKGTDGKVGFVSIEHYLNQRPIFGSFWQQISTVMQLGERGEQWSATPALAAPPAASTDRLLNFSRIADLTRRHSLDPALATRLVGLLSLAAQAESNGDLAAKNKALESYMEQVERQQLRAFSWGMAQSLTALASSM